MADETGGPTSPESGDSQGGADAIEQARETGDVQFEVAGQEKDREKGGRKIAPIPPPSKGTGKLPGVQSRGDEDLFAGLDRDERGRFVGRRGEGEEKPDQKAKPPAAPPAPGDEAPGQKPAAPPVPAPTAAALKFLGKDYGSIGEVEQLHRSLQGQFKSLTEQRDYGYQTANGWHAEAVRLKAELDQLRGQPGGGAVQGQAAGRTAPAAGAGTGSLTVEEILKDIDTDAFEQIAADEQGGLPSAGKYLIGETLKVVLEKVVPALEARVSARFQPFEQANQEAATRSSADQLVTSVASFVTHDGQPAFPELSDPQQIEEIGRIWAETGLPPEHVLTPQGLISAVGLYRVYKGLPDAGAARAAQSAPAVRTTPTPVATPAPGSAASLPDNGASRPASNGRAHGDPRVAALLSGFNERDLLAENVLGFQRNRRPADF